ncbi:MAG: tetratricopeptide repeat protein [Saprospiraceae bacterium]|nr:tetratricopeptide repeat protein [Saprospiraceae bacterium]
MKITYIYFMFLVVFTAQLHAQETVEPLVREGIQYHDKGEFDKAIDTYKKALKIDPTSTLVNYEIALSYFSKGEYEKSITYADIVLKQKKDNILQAYLTKGSALDLLGKTEASIQLFEEAIKNTEGHYLLHYNLALNYYNLNDLDNAEENILLAMDQNISHSSSHFMLANIYNKRGYAVQTILASHFFLFLEPQTNRSTDALAMVKFNMNKNVSKSDSEPNTTNIQLNLDDNNEFSSAELLLSMMSASNEENKDKTEEELFIEQTTTFFETLRELNKGENSDIWKGFYIPFFNEILDGGHFETYCHYILEHASKDSMEWVKANPDKMESFSKWLEGL